MGSVNKVQDFSVLTTNTLIKVPYTEINASYAGLDFDVYTYKNGATTVGTITVTWTDATKSVLLKIVVS